MLPVVLYNGDAPWRSTPEVGDLIVTTGPELARFQPSQGHIVLDERHTSADDPHLDDLTRAMVLVEQSQSLEDLAQAGALLRAQLRGRRDELRQAFADWLDALLQRLERPAGSEPAARGRNLEEVTMTLEERVAEWPKPYLRQGRQEGREEGVALGREEGVAQQRMLLRRQAAERFGAATADRLASALAAEADAERLAEVAIAIVRCTTGDELLRKVGGTA